MALFYLTVKHGGSFMYLAVLACLFESLGYATIGFGDNSTYVLFPVAKLIMCLVNYIVIGRLLRASGKDTIFSMDPQLVSALLQFIGAVTIFIQPIIGIMMALTGGGSGYMHDETGTGLILLLIRSTPFASILWTIAFSEDFLMWEIPELRGTFYCLFSTFGLILVSDIYGILAYTSPYESYLRTNEVPFIIFEMMTMLICFTVCTVFHYGRVTPMEFLRGYGRSAPLLGITGLQYRRLPVVSTAY